LVQKQETCFIAVDGALDKANCLKNKIQFYAAFDWKYVQSNYKSINSLKNKKFFFPQRFRGLLQPDGDTWWINEESDPEIKNCYKENMPSISAAIRLSKRLGFNRIYLYKNNKIEDV